MRSLKARLVGLWGLSLLSSLVLGVLLVSLYRQSTAAQVGRSQAVLARSCDLIRDRYGFYVAGWTGPAAGDADAPYRRNLGTVLDVALAHQEGVEGGIWASGAGSLAYAFPTYEGSGPKTDLPAAEADQIAALNAAAISEERPVTRTIAARAQTLLLAACPLEGPVAGASAWVMTRVQAATGFRSMQFGMLVLLALLSLTTVLLFRTMQVWGRHVRTIESALGGVGEAGLPAVGRFGERELDRIVDALNLAGRRLADARRESDGLAAQVARSERLAALGRVSAGMAHEIRNPIAAARLQGENALAGGDGRWRQGIADMIVQLDRLDTLVTDLLAMTQRVQPTRKDVDLAPFLADVAAPHRDAATERGLALSVDCPAMAASFDPVIVSRILDNLLGNAIRHAAANGAVTLSGRKNGQALVLAVTDDGPGIPADMAERLFEPFVTGRADGTGLGLAIARELADAHGGHLVLRHPGGAGAPTDFALELPQEAAWQPS